MKAKSKAPDKLNNRHKYAALLMAMGWRPGKIAKRVGMCTTTLAIVRGSPLFQTLVEQYQREFVSRGMQTTIDKVMADGPANVDFIRQIRDGLLADVKEIDDPNDRVRHRLHAASLLFDRQLPKKQEGDTGTKVQVIVEARHREIAEDACADVGEPIDVTPEPVKRLAPPVAQTIPRDLDEVIREYEEREAVGE